MSARQTTPAETLEVYLDALVGREPSGMLEVRWRHGDGMRRRVYRVADQLVDAAAAIGALGARTDLYVGCAPRRRRAGGRDAVADVWVLWADCDTPQASAALRAFRPAPAIVVRSAVIRSDQLQRGWRRADPCWRHVASESESDAAGGRR